MTLYVKQRVFSIGDEFHICDCAGEEQFSAVGEICTVGKHISLYNAHGNHIASIDQELFRLLPHFVLETDTETAIIARNFSFFCYHFSVSPQNWTVEGELFAHSFIIADENGQKLADIDKKWFSIGDAYEIAIYSEKNVNLLLAVVLAIDATLALSRGRGGFSINIGGRS